MSKPPESIIHRPLKPNNEFLYINQFLENKTHPQSRKGLAHLIVAGLHQLDHNIAFEKEVFSANSCHQITQSILKHLELGGQRPFGVVTCFINDREAMGKAPFWYGARGGTNNISDLYRFLLGESEANGYWPITNQERQRYPWLTLGYEQTLQKYPLTDSILTIHPPGYDQQRENHFVGRFRLNKEILISLELKLGTTLLRDLDAQTSPHEMISKEISQHYLRIGSSYIVSEILKGQPIKELLDLATQIATEPSNTKIEQAKQIFSMLKILSKSPEKSAKLLNPLILYKFKNAFQLGINLGKQHNQATKNIDVEQVIRQQGIDFLENLRLHDPEQYTQIETRVRETTQSCLRVISKSLMPEGSLFRIKDLFAAIEPFGFTQIEIIGQIGPTPYSKIFEVC